MTRKNKSSILEKITGIGNECPLDPPSRIKSYLWPGYFPAKFIQIRKYWEKHPDKKPNENQEQDRDITLGIFTSFSLIIYQTLAYAIVPLTAYQVIKYLSER